MAISFDKAFGVHEQAIQVRSKKAELLVQNIANVDTPGFKAKDIDFRAALAKEQKLGSLMAMEGTSELHIQKSPSTNMVAGTEVLYRRPNAPSLDGNTVEMDLEQAQFAENNMRHEASIQFLSGKIMGLIKAIKGES